VHLRGVQSVQHDQLLTADRTPSPPEAPLFDADLKAEAPRDLLQLRDHLLRFHTPVLPLPAPGTPGYAGTATSKLLVMSSPVRGSRNRKLIGDIFSSISSRTRKRCFMNQRVV